MNVLKIYNNYKIVPQLQLHMLRVAGVASIICDCIQQKIEDIEHEEGMFPLKLMLACFIIFALVLVLYRISH